MRPRHFSHNLRDNLFDVIFFSKVLHFVAVFISPTRCGLICLPKAGELTRTSCELLFATILHQRRYGEYAVYNYKLFSSFSCFVSLPTCYWEYMPILLCDNYVNVFTVCFLSLTGTIISYSNLKISNYWRCHWYDRCPALGRHRSVREGRYFSIISQ